MLVIAMKRVEKPKLKKDRHRKSKKMRIFINEKQALIESVLCMKLVFHLVFFSLFIAVDCRIGFLCFVAGSKCFICTHFFFVLSFQYFFTVFTL